MSKHDNQGMDRRTFMKFGAAGTAAAVGSGHAMGEEASSTEKRALRTLGRTGMKVGVVGIGTFRITEPAIMQAAFDKGINFLDTARGYHDGRGEGYVGEALKGGYRDKVYICTKVVPGSERKMTRDIEKSLAALGTDYVDILMLHYRASKEDVLNEVSRKVLLEAKKQGKARFLGISTHENEVEVLNAMTDDPDHIYDTVMVKYNFKSDQAIKDAVARAAKAGIGIIAMKTQAGGYKTEELGAISPHQAALKAILQDPNVATTVPSMVNLDQIKEDVEVMYMDQKVTRVDRQILDQYAQAIAPYYCQQCGACKATCPKGVDIPNINRCLMYAEGYRDLANAKASYAAIPNSVSLAACGDCATCQAQCVNSITLTEQLGRAKSYFA